MEGAREGHEDVVKLLVEHGANINAQTEETQETAITLASCGGFLEVVQYLIEHSECGTAAFEHSVLRGREIYGLYGPLTAMYNTIFSKA